LAFPSGIARGCAQTNWTGTISSDWFTAGNWAGGDPESDDD
jgi:hypothetical protein